MIRAAIVLLAVMAAQAAADDLTDALLRSQQLIERGDLGGARAELGAALKRFPEDSRLYNFMGVVEAQSGAFEAAEEALRRAVQLAPQFTGAYLNLGRLYQEHPDKAGAVEKGIAAYRAVLAYEPGHVEANFQAAALLVRQGSYRAALLHLDRLPAAARGRAQALALRCAAQAGSGSAAAAVAETAQRLAAASDLSEEDVVGILPALLGSKRSGTAILLLEALRDRSLASAESLQRLGALYEAGDRYAEARAAFEKAAATAGAASPAALLDLARVAYKQGDRQGSLGYLAHARDMEPGNAAIHYSFGVICLELNVPLDAAESLKKAVELAPENPSYNYALGIVLANGKDPSEAIPYLQKYSHDPRGRFALGFAYFGSAQYEAARKEFEAAAGHRALAAGAHCYLGRIAMLEGDEAGAVSELRKAIAADPKYADAYAELGLYHLQRKEYTAAERELRRALALDPDGLRANLNLLTLYRRTRDLRAEAQSARFEEVQKKRWEKQVALLRRVVVRPY